MIEHQGFDHLSTDDKTVFFPKEKDNHHLNHLATDVIGQPVHGTVLIKRLDDLPDFENDDIRLILHEIHDGIQKDAKLMQEFIKNDNVKVFHFGGGNNNNNNDDDDDRYIWAYERMLTRRFKATITRRKGQEEQCSIQLGKPHIH